MVKYGLVRQMMVSTKNRKEAAVLKVLDKKDELSPEGIRIMTLIRDELWEKNSLVFDPLNLSSLE